MTLRSLNTPILPATTESILKAADLLKQGEIVALPSETVYGLAGNATSETVVKKIFSAKERPAFDPLIVHLSSKILSQPKTPIRYLMEQKILGPEMNKWISLTLIENAMKKFWPGPLTLVLPRGEAIPNEVTSGQSTVAIRVPAHPLFQSVLNKLDFPLAAPSANRFGRISPTQAEHVSTELDGRIAAILDGGPCEVGVESTIIKIEDDPLRVTLLRPGKISIPELQVFFGVEMLLPPNAVNSSDDTPEAPGMLDQHYAPKKNLVLVPHPFTRVRETIEFLNEYDFKNKTIGFLAMNQMHSSIPQYFPGKVTTLSEQNSLEEMAKNLFATLRRLDEDPSIQIIVADAPEASLDGLGQALRDRLNRASINKPF